MNIYGMGNMVVQGHGNVTLSRHIVIYNNLLIIIILMYIYIIIIIIIVIIISVCSISI